MISTIEYKGGRIVQSAWSKRDVVPAHMAGTSKIEAYLPNGRRIGQLFVSERAAKLAITRALNP